VALTDAAGVGTRAWRKLRGVYDACGSVRLPATVFDASQSTEATRWARHDEVRLP
jgi:hypothetical protein